VDKRLQKLHKQLSEEITRRTSISPRAARAPIHCGPVGSPRPRRPHPQDQGHRPRSGQLAVPQNEKDYHGRGRQLQRQQWRAEWQRVRL